ncbi:MAG TPA: hypothetical protein VM689_20485 [Aliidongia sp.]|nr:hypothetical protein [Aliidongia sp.]
MNFIPSLSQPVSGLSPARPVSAASAFEERPDNVLTAPYSRSVAASFLAIVAFASIPPSTDYRTMISTPTTVDLPSSAAAIARLNSLFASARRSGRRIEATKEQFRAAILFVHHLYKHSLPMPHISIADDGEILFFGRSGGYYLDIGVQRDGTLSVFAKSPDDEDILIDGIQAESFISARLAKVIRAVC